MTWCVYAITSAAGRRLGVRGIQGERLTLVGAGRLAAVVGSVTRIAPPSDVGLRRYHAVQEELFRRLPAVLPARYGTSLDSLDRLRLLLHARESALRQSLRLVRGRAQMTIRLAGSSRAQEEHLGAVAPRGSAHRRASTTGLAYLRQRAASAARARAVPAFDPLRPAVRRWVRAERVEWAAGVATIYHLVPRGAARAYAGALARAAGRQQVPAVVSGPFPPFAFSDG